MNLKTNVVNQVYEHDIECFPNYFNVGLKDFKTKETINLEISEEHDDRLAIYKFFSTYKGYLVSFNGIHYDNMVLKFFVKHWNKLKTLSKEDLLSTLKHFSDKVIDADNYYEELKTYKYQKQTWTDIDLMLYWSKMLRISKKISLKSLAVQLGYAVIQELPYPPNKTLNLEELRNVRHYNNVHDLGILDMLAEKMRDDIKLRLNIKKDYDIDCMSLDAIKIASEALLQDYCKNTNQNPDDVRKLRFHKGNIYVKDILTDFNPNFTLPVFQDLYNRILNSVNDFSEEITVVHNNTSIRLSYGIGGLHAINQNEKYFKTKTHRIITSDVASLYPNLIINYRCIRFPEVLARYIGIKDERIVAKKNKVKSKDLFFKLILNGISGLLDQEHSWLYYPEGALRLRLIGQLILTKAIELCVLKGWQVISANTKPIGVIK